MCNSVFIYVSAQSGVGDSALSAFRSICGEDGVSLGEAVREQHGKDESVHRSASPISHTKNQTLTCTDLQISRGAAIFLVFFSRL